MGRSFCRPSGIRSKNPLYPGLTPWAKLFRRSAAGFFVLYAPLRFAENQPSRAQALILLCLDGAAENRAFSGRSHLVNKF